MTPWQRWLHHPEHSPTRQVLFQIHFWVGAAASAYVFVMGLSGAIIVFRNLAPGSIVMERLVQVHTVWMSGERGHTLNAVGALGLIVLCVTGAVVWWPGVQYWRRSLRIEWRARFPRISWDAHSALGLWFLPFLTMWAISGLYLAQPALFEVLLRFDPSDRVVDRGLFALAALHFGRFNRVTEVVWAIAGVVPAALAFTGVFICCRRVLWQKPSHP